MRKDFEGKHFPETQFMLVSESPLHRPLISTVSRHKSYPGP